MTQPVATGPRIPQSYDAFDFARQLGIVAWDARTTLETLVVMDEVAHAPHDVLESESDVGEEFFHAGERCADFCFEVGRIGFRSASDASELAGGEDEAVGLDHLGVGVSSGLHTVNGRDGFRHFCSNLFWGWGRTKE